MTIMKSIKSIITTSFLIFLIPFAFAAGQEKKSEQRIKIVIEEDGGPEVILDTLITGKPLSDSIVLKDGKTLYLIQEGSDNAPCTPGSKKYIVTASASDGGDQTKQINKEITIISSDSDISDEKGCAKIMQLNCGSSKTGEIYTYTIRSDNNDSNSERTKYVIARDGIEITVEGSDYARVKEYIKDIEKMMDTKSGVK